MVGGSEPVIMRHYAGGHSGATAFFRNRPFVSTLTAILRKAALPTCRVLVHACSIGAEPYSLALQWLKTAPTRGSRRIEIIATDVEPAFLEIARRAVYPKAIADGLTGEERAWFEPHPDGFRVPAEARALVTFLPPMSVVDDDPGVEADAVLVMNAFTHLTPANQRTAITRIGRYTRRVLGVTAFHPDTIRADVSRAGFVPVERGRQRIHAAWGRRLTSDPIVPGSADYSWRLPPYDAAAQDAEWRFSSLFIRREQDATIGRRAAQRYSL